MGIDLESLRADVARWAERFAPYREDDNDWYRAAENIDGKDASELGNLFAELARHLGAGQPVAGTGETLYRLCDACLGVTWVVTAEDRETHIGCDVCCGEGYVPVAPPEPLSAEEWTAVAQELFAQCERYQWVGHRKDHGWHQSRKILRAVLEALPERFAVPVEGA